MSLDRVHVTLFSTIFVCSISSLEAESAASRSSQVIHVMLFWLKRPGNVGDQNVLLRGLRALRHVRDVNRVRVGCLLPVDRPGFEQSFDLGLVIIFRDREALERFERDPRRRGALDAMLQLLIRRYVVFKFADE